jgi:hypothetical protein
MFRVIPVSQSIPKMPVLAKNSSQLKSGRFPAMPVGPKTLANEGRQKV